RSSWRSDRSGLRAAGTLFPRAPGASLAARSAPPARRPPWCGRSEPAACPEATGARPRRQWPRSPPAPPAGPQGRARSVGSRPASLPLDGSHVPQLVEPVEGRDLVALGERRVVEDRVDEVLDGALVGHDGLADVDQFRRAGPDRMDAQERVALLVDQELE